MYNKTKKAHIYYVYILANKRNGTLYIGITNDLFNRNFQHKLKQDSNSFTAKYNVDKLVYFEEYQTAWLTGTPGRRFYLRSREVQPPNWRLNIHRPEMEPAMENKVNRKRQSNPARFVS